MKQIFVLLAVAAFGVAGGVERTQADENLWCKIKADAARPSARSIPFFWSASHGATENPTGPLKTSIGVIEPGDTQTRITLDGKPVPLPAGARGPIWSGRVIDLGKQVAIAFLVEGPNDSSALPSEALLVIERGPVVVASDVIPGEQVSYDEKPCGLID